MKEIAANRTVILTREVCLAHPPTPPVQILTLLAVPISGLTLNGTFVPGVYDRGVLQSQKESVSITKV